jgi:hypothetical protein
VARDIAYRAANQDELRARKVAGYAANPEKARARSAAYRAANRNEVRERLAAYRAANIDKVKVQKAAHEANKRVAYKAALALVPLVEDLKARVVALEALIGQSHFTASVDRIAPERPRRKRAVHEHHTPAPAVPSATPPIIRTIKDIVDHDRVTAAEAKRIQEREILARAEWRPSPLM